MITDPELRSIAQMLIDSYGREAFLHAENRAAETRRRGDRCGQAIWQAVGAVVRERLHRHPTPEQATVAHTETMAGRIPAAGWI